MAIPSPLRQRAMARAIGGLLAAGMLLHSPAAAAIGLVQAYQAALQNDPTFQSAIHDYEAGKENEVLGRSGLLPNVSAVYANSKDRADVTATDTSGVPNLTHPKYNSRNAEVSLRQPIFNLDALARYKQGKAQASYAGAVLDTHRHEMIVRVATAYTDALFAEEQLRLASAQYDAYVEQRKANDRLYAQGEGTRTDMLETQARQDQAEAQVLEMRDNVQTARATLAGVIGQPVQELDDLRPGFRIMPVNSSFEEWKDIAVKNNPELVAGAFAVAAAHQEVNRGWAGHAPRLDFVASYAKTNAQTVDTYNQNSTVRSIGIELNIPIYAGGSVNAATRQASAGELKAKSDLKASNDKVMVELLKQYSAVISSVSRIHALDKAVESGQLLITATQQSIKGGVRINVDLLNARQQLYTSQRDLAQARYNYLLASLRLKAAAGVLDASDIVDMATYFN